MKLAAIARGLTLLALAIATAAPATAAPVFLAPHRAVYDLKLLKTTGSRGISAVRGRILYDFSGSPCEGYTLKFRQVSQIDSGEGNGVLSDLRSTTWEDEAAKKFSFNSQNLLNDQQTQSVDGNAARDDQGGDGEAHQAGRSKTLNAAGGRGVSHRSHAPHHRGGARRQDHPAIPGL